MLLTLFTFVANKTTKKERSEIDINNLNDNESENNERNEGIELLDNLQTAHMLNHLNQSMTTQKNALKFLYDTLHKFALKLQFNVFMKQLSQIKVKLHFICIRRIWRMRVCVCGVM